MQNINSELEIIVQDVPRTIAINFMAAAGSHCFLHIPGTDINPVLTVMETDGNQEVIDSLALMVPNHGNILLIPTSPVEATVVITCHTEQELRLLYRMLQKALEVTPCREDYNQIMDCFNHVITSIQKTEEVEKRLLTANPN